MAEINENNESLNTFLSKRSRDPDFYWAIITDNKGKRHVSGPYNSEQEASQICVGSAGMADFKIVALKTSSKERATQQLKQILFKDSKNIIRSTERVSHKLY